MAVERTKLPRARAGAELVVQELPGEVLVYDERRQKAHCLNECAALVWRRCDGKTTVAEMIAALERHGLAADAEVVALALTELRRANLLDDQDDDAPATQALSRSRRRALKRLGMVAGVALALPIVQSIVAPSIAEAASCLPRGGPCNANNQCCSRLCLGNSTCA